MMRRGRRIVAVVFAAAVVAAAGIAFRRWWQWRAEHVSTDNAYIQATVVLISPRIPGTITELPVTENRPVQKGDVLCRLDRGEYVLPLREAEAVLAQTILDIEAARARVRAAESGAARARAELEQARRDLRRAETLHRSGAASAERVERARTDVRVAAARLAAAEDNLEAARTALGIPVDAPAQQSPRVQRAQAARDRAQLHLQWTEIRAPADGIVATKAAHVGERVVAGQLLMRLVRHDTFYVEANFKETQLARVRPGQPATVVADMYPDMPMAGIVDSLAPGTGAAFSLLPPENATGNWIKVVQRLPVRIRLDHLDRQHPPLAVGLSVRVTIDTSETASGADTGH